MIAEKDFYFHESSRFLSNYMTGEFSLTNSPSGVPNMSIELMPDRKYQVEYHIHYSGTSTTEGISIGISGSNSAYYARGDLIINDFSKSPKVFAVTGYNQMQTNSQGDTDVANILMNVFIVNSGQRSTLSLLAAKETAGADAVSITRGSWVTVTEY
jgi:hypothetical protein